MNINICKECGKEFESVSTYRAVCDECRAEIARIRQQVRRNGEIRKEWEPVKYFKRINLDRDIEKAREKKLKAIRTDINCPNYDPTRTDCACCAADSWKYKSCGGTK